ncbi:probable LRR receptor-like serine/threonine-protein kinase At4g30520, partial [Herrania umbratica]|uniref:Probable LRR receptor-like serine/threonine-protein kinase At4g30520 n=1 Tax=Herrania umbratica TaxID=108875 RepID=A0A6J1BMC5_9ROSI
MQNQGSKGFLRLEQLETLDLTCNNLGNNTLQSLRKLTSLKNLILRSNLLEGSFPVQELSVFESLETLDLSQNFINGFPTML